MKKTLVGLFLGVLLTFFVSGQALASYATAEAKLDLSSISTLLSNLAPTTDISASATSNGVTIDGVPAGTTVSASYAGISDGTATSTANVFTSAANTYEIGYTFPAATASSAISTVGGAYYTYTGPDIVNQAFSITYSALLSLSTMNGENAMAGGSYAVWFYITTINGVDGFNEQNIPVPGYKYYYEITDTVFTFYLTLKNGDEVWLDYGTAASVNSSAVPLPAAFWLLGSGVFGLIGIRRRNKA